MSVQDQQLKQRAGDGTGQSERFPAALNPASAPLEGRDARTLTSVAQDLAAGLTFWHLNGDFDLTGQWRKFLPVAESVEKQTLQQWRRQAEAEAAKCPQKALFLAFLNLYEKAGTELNRVTARHLQFYYRQVLGLFPRPPAADRVHLLVLPKKTAGEVVLPMGTRFQTADGIAFATEQELIASHAELIHRRMLFQHPETGRIHYAAVANSLDGLGEELPKDDPHWHPFGFNSNHPAARIGFALSSPVLHMREGDRSIVVTLELQTDAGFINGDQLAGSSTGAVSGESEWIDLGNPAVTVTDLGGNRFELKLEFTVGRDAEPVSPFDPTVLEGGYDTLAPVLKIELNEDAPASLIQRLGNATVESVEIDVDVKEMKDLVLEHDYGRVDPSKAFQPFGPVPRTGSSFYINAEEALTKDVTSVKLHLDWNAPASSLSTWYGGYTNNSGTKLVSSNADFTADLEILRDGRFESLKNNTRLFQDNAGTERVIDSEKDESPQLSFSGFNFLQFARLHSKPVRSARVQFPFARLSVSKPLRTLQPARAIAFKQELFLPALKIALGLKPNSQRGFLRLRLNRDFLHSKYPEIYASVISHNQKEGNESDQRPVPNPPYTPELARFSLDYHAKSQATDPNATGATDFENRDVRLFHLTPFGQREEHAYLKESIGAENKSVTLLPALQNAGELYLGLSRLQPGQSISLLFQMQEGTANPLADGEPVSWSVLCNNHWKSVPAESLLSENTNNLLHSGVVRIVLPSDATDQNTFLDPGQTWIRAAIANDISAVCKVTAIHPNAVPAVRQAVASSASDSMVLPSGSIKDPPDGFRHIREVQQPYASFGGKGAESLDTFRTRTSERLRHRNRAVTAWDFERLVLDTFPSVYRVMVLRHTRRDLKSRPGHATLVLIPDTRNREELNPLQPYTDLATLEAVEDLLDGIKTPFAGIAAINPVYEPLTLRFKVAFHPGHPFPTYRKILDEALRRHLAPWSSEDALLPDFNAVILRSTLLAFIESLEYVDYLTDLELIPAGPHGDPRKIQEVRPSGPASIVTSAAGHQIENAEP